MFGNNHREQAGIFPVTRRRFVQGAAAGAAVAACGWGEPPAFGATTPYHPPVLRGTEFELTIDSMPVNVTGRQANATVVNGSMPGPVLRWREGDTVTLAVTNKLRVPTSIHWHSLRIPAAMDGVPGLSFPGIAPGETFQYRFPVRQNGTAWYHSHSRFQEQTGLIGALIIDPRGDDPIRYDREYVLFLSDWTDTDPDTVFSNLKQESDYYNYHRDTGPGLFAAAKKDGLGRTIARRLAWARMNMSPNDISDVSGATYTYLLNGNAPAANWTGLFEPGEKVRLRVINGAAMSFFDVRIPGLKMTVVQADGNHVEPVTVDEFRIGVAERYDVIVEPREHEAYTIFAQAEDRTGYARGTLTPRLGMVAAVPPMDPRPRRTMQDMGMGEMNGMQMRDMAGVDGMTGKDMSMPQTGGRKEPAMEGMSMHPGARMTAAQDMSSMSGMEMGSSTGTTPFPQPGPDTMPIATLSKAAMKASEARLQPAKPVTLHIGPQVSQVSKHVEERLDMPGDGLDNNGRRVLTYADLRALYRGVDGRPPTREILLHLSGNMNRYIWGFNGEKFSSAQPIVLKLGERVRFVLINDTMMEHPIHLHGLWSELENGNGAFNPYKDTIVIKPSERVSYLVSADTPGRWAYHCHLLYHMEAGMFRTVMVTE